MSDSVSDVWDPIRAAANLRSEMTSDWYRDPWGWPEYNFLLNNQPSLLIERANGRELKRVVRIDVPKENFGVRPAVVIEPVDRLLYQSMVDLISINLIGDLQPWVHGWRLHRQRPQAGRYSPSDFEWKQYRGQLKSDALFFTYGLKTDITSCFPSIPVDRVCEDIQRKAGDNVLTKRLILMLEAFDNIPGRGGLVQRSTASSVLANMYIERIRYIFAEHIQRNKGPRLLRLGEMPTLRWMDDFWVFGDDEANLRALQVDLQGALREAGLELNLGKTKLLADEDLWSAAAQVEHSAVDAAIDLTPPDMAPLEDLLDRIIADPEDSDRTTIRFAMTRMRKQNVRSRVDSVVQIAPRAPHGADHIARAFQDFGIWKTHEDWYLEYVASSWSKFSWSVAQLGTMFPSSTTPSSSVRHKFAEFVSQKTDFPLLALAMQRLSSWDPDLTADLLHEVVKTADHPQERRLIGLAAAAARQESTFIRRVLGEYDENRVTLQMLAERNFAPFEPVPDFSADEEP